MPSDLNLTPGIHMQVEEMDRSLLDLYIHVCHAYTHTHTKNKIVTYPNHFVNNSKSLNSIHTRATAHWENFWWQDPRSWGEAPLSPFMPWAEHSEPDPDSRLERILRYSSCGRSDRLHSIVRKNISQLEVYQMPEHTGNSSCRRLSTDRDTLPGYCFWLERASDLSSEKSRVRIQDLSLQL